jgi:hypothetical protein
MKIMKPAIDKDIPIPKRKTGRASKFEYLLGMKVKDSVMVNTYRDACTAQMLLSRHNMVATIRKQEDGKYRVWRIK